MPAHIEEKLLYLRHNYHLGQLPIIWSLQCDHGIKPFSGAAYTMFPNVIA